MGEGGERERGWVSVRVWGDSKKSRPIREKATRLGGDQMRKALQVMVGSEFYPDGSREPTDTVKDLQQERDTHFHMLEGSLAAGWKVDWKRAVLEKRGRCRLPQQPR